MPPSSMFRTARPIFNTFASSSASRSQFASSFTRQAFRNGGKRFQSTDAGAAPKKSWFKMMWDSPVGLKTVHFWAPCMKWALVLAGVSDFWRPAEKLSLTQNAALTATGAIWTRWCLIIKPRNIFLAAVNFFLGVVGVVQVTRIIRWRLSPEGKAFLAKAEAEAAAEKESAIAA